jgi:hypothetical protein
MTRGHGEALNSMDGGVQGSGVISIRSTDTIRAENGDEDSEFTAVNKKIDVGEKRSGINGDAGGGRDSDEERDWVGKSRVENRLGVEKVKRT